MKIFIVHEGTETILDAQECVLVPFFGELEQYSDEAILKSAKNPLQSIRLGDSWVG